MSTSPTPNLRTEIVTMTPTEAQKILDEANIHNRPLRESTVETYVRDMQAGRWELTAEPIKFDPDGVLLDGQHRLAAVARSGVTVTMFVVHGVDAHAQRVMDSGIKRTAGDQFATFTDFKYPTRVAAAARLALQFDLNLNTGKAGVSNAEVQEFVEANPDLPDAVAFVGHRQRHVPLPPSVIDYCTFRLLRIDEAAAKDFLEGLASGAGLHEGNPILALRRRLTGGYGAQRRISTEERISLVFRAWNAWRAGKSITKLPTFVRGDKVSIPEPQ